MAADTPHPRSSLLDERSPTPFRTVFRELISGSTELDTAILRVRLSGVDLSPRELRDLRRLRILVADLNAQTLEEEAFALLMDPSKRETLTRIQSLLSESRLELRAAPLAGWSPDFSIFSGPDGPRALLLGLHWVQRPFPHRGPAWLARFGAEEARCGHRRFCELWREGHEIGPAVLKLLDRATRRWGRRDGFHVRARTFMVESEPSWHRSDERHPRRSAPPPDEKPNPVAPEHENPCVEVGDGKVGREGGEAVDTPPGPG